MFMISYQRRENLKGATSGLASLMVTARSLICFTVAAVVEVELAARVAGSMVVVMMSKVSCAMRRTYFTPENRALRFGAKGPARSARRVKVASVSTIRPMTSARTYFPKAARLAGCWTEIVSRTIAHISSELHAISQASARAVMNFVIALMERPKKNAPGWAARFGVMAGNVLPRVVSATPVAVS